jgi:hypothetical protein
MVRAMTVCRLVRPLLVAAISLVTPMIWADPPPSLRTNRVSQQVLPLPKGEDMFHFVVFGDRTGGPPEGVQVLAQAVRDTNLLDPDLVMTVGDLIQGYNGQDLWEKQMLEYRQTMAALRMPWFPVAGNHDIYWRGDGRPPTEHEANYEKHFGPLWYWFEHKQCGFLVLHSDEGDPASPAVPRDFGQPAQQKFSDAQLGWLRGALAEMKSLRHVFVFMHHPRWAADIYPGTNWPEVHGLLRANGNVRACFAGHIHRLRHDGVKDGIEYMALATTGGSMPGDYPRVGYLHHFNVITVRPDGIKAATVPVGAVIDPRLFTPERAADLDSVRRMTPVVASSPMTLTSDGLGAGVYELKLSNPSRRAVEFTLSVEADPGEWIITPDHQHAVVEAGQEKAFAFTYVRVRSAFTSTLQPPVFELQADSLEEGARTTLPPRRFPAHLRLGDLPPEVFAAPPNEVAVKLAGEKSGVRVDSAHFELPDGPFTLEGWVRPEKQQPTAGLIAKTQRSEYGLLAENGVVNFLVLLGDQYASAAAQDPLPLGEWSHVAGVFDGQSVALFINGTLAARAPAAGARQRNDLPLYLGADPDDKGNPTRALDGWVDEVRLSTGARYTDAFTPNRRHEPDASTVLLFHLDRLVGDLVPDRGAAKAHGRLTGGAALSPAP